MKYGPLALTASTSSYIASGVASNGAAREMPAFTNSMSSVPNSFLTQPARASMSGSEAVSLSTTVAPRPSLPRATSSLAFVRPVTSTCAPLPPGIPP